MKQDYNQSIDIFSLGVTLFVMLTGFKPFSRIVELQDTGGYIKTERYSLFLSDMKQYWREYVGYKTIVDQSCKQLLSKMLAFDPKDRFTMSKITQHEWYTGECVANGSKLKNHVDSLLKQKLYFKGLEFESPSTTLTPISMDETNPNVLFSIKSTSEIKVIFETLKNCIQNQLNGNIDDAYDKDDNVLVCFFPHTKNNKEQVEIAAALYLSRRWNSRESLRKLNEVIAAREDSNNSDSDTKLSEEEVMPMVYVLKINEIDGRDVKLQAYKDIIIKALETVDCKPFEKISLTPKWKSLVGNVDNHNMKQQDTHVDHDEVSILICAYGFVLTETLSIG